MFKFNSMYAALQKHDPETVRKIEAYRMVDAQRQAFVVSLEWLLTAARLWRVDADARLHTLRRQVKQLTRERDLAIRQKVHLERQLRVAMPELRAGLESGLQVQLNAIIRKTEQLNHLVPEMRAMRERLTGSPVVRS